MCGTLTVTNRIATDNDGIPWDTDVPESVNRAGSEFYRRLEEGYAAFKTDGKDGPGEQISDFDPSASEILMLAPLVGG